MYYNRIYAYNIRRITINTFIIVQYEMNGAIIKINDTPRNFL